MKGYLHELLAKPGLLCANVQYSCIINITIGQLILGNNSPGLANNSFSKYFCERWAGYHSNGSTSSALAVNNSQLATCNLHDVIVIP